MQTSLYPYWALTHYQCSLIFWMSHVYYVGNYCICSDGNQSCVRDWMESSCSRRIGRPWETEETTRCRASSRGPRYSCWLLMFLSMDLWISGLTQNCDSCIAYVVELLQSWAKQLIYSDVNVGWGGDGVLARNMHIIYFNAFGVYLTLNRNLPLVSSSDI